MKMKKLLASALAAAMVVSSMVGTLVTSAAETVGTITAETVDIEVGAKTFDADITIDFPDTVVAPHNIITIAADGYVLDAVALKNVIYAGETVQGKVTIGDENNENGSNLAAGKILLECPVDDYQAPTVSQIVITATFIEDDTANAAGTYAIKVNGDDMTNKAEDDIAIDSKNGVLNVHGAATDVDYDENNHWNVCVIENCDAHKYNETAHVLGDYVANEDGTTETASCDCGYAHTRDSEVVGPVLDESLSSALTPAIQVKSTVGINYTIKLPLANYDDFELVVSRNTYDGSYNLIPMDDVVFDKSNTDDTYGAYGWYYAAYTGVGMYEMSLDISATLYAYKDGKKVAYYTYKPTSITDLALSNFTTTTNDTLKSLMVDLLNMGTEAQLYFAKDGSDLKNAALPNASADQSFASEYGELTNVGASNTSALSAQVKMGASPALSYTAIVNSTYSAADLTFTATYYDELTKTQHTFSHLGTDSEVDSSWATYGYYYFPFVNVALYDGDKTVTAQVVYKAGTSDEVVVATNTYSVESYIAANINSAAAGDILKSIAAFGVSARAWFYK